MFITPRLAAWQVGDFKIFFAYWRKSKPRRTFCRFVDLLDKK